MIEMRSAHASHVGQVRSTNQDRALAAPGFGVVADGMGGHQGGERAASIVVEEFDSVDAPLSADDLVELIQQANRRVIRSGEDPELRGMGTTVVAAALDAEAGALAVANVGDSRAYRLRGELFEQLTVDHSLVEELVRQGRISAEDARAHPQRNIVTRALGLGDPIDVDLFRHRAEHGDRLLLCTDGLFNEVEVETIAGEMNRAAEPDEVARRLIDLALEAGARDNVSVVVADLIDPEMPPAERSEAVTITTTGPDEPTRPHAPIPLADLGTGETRTSSEERSGARTLAPYAAGALVALLVLFGAVTWLGRSSWFVGTEDGEVVVFQGRPGGLLWVDPTVAERTGIAADELSPAAQERLAAEVEWGSLDDAMEFVGTLSPTTEDASTGG